MLFLFIFLQAAEICTTLQKYKVKNSHLIVTYLHLARQTIKRYLG